jgi:hypothetical protein
MHARVCICTLLDEFNKRNSIRSFRKRFLELEIENLKRAVVSYYHCSVCARRCATHRVQHVRMRARFECSCAVIVDDGLPLAVYKAFARGEKIGGDS